MTEAEVAHVLDERDREANESWGLTEKGQRALGIGEPVN